MFSRSFFDEIDFYSDITLAIESFAKRLLRRIVWELEKIPEPMQLRVLAFIHTLEESSASTDRTASKSARDIYIMLRVILVE
jgi:hypothetical protein